MARDVISTCPVCEGELAITRLHSRGNLKDLERELGISYPTVRGRVEALLRALGLADGDSSPADEAEAIEADDPNQADADKATERRAILDRLARREISADEAAEALRAVGGA